MMNNYKFNLSEIFEIAVQIERNGADFYRKASLKFYNDLEIKTLLLELAAQEDIHEKTFSDILHKALTNNVITTNDELTRQYLDAIAGQFVFDKSRANEELTDDMTRQDIFETAILKEKDSIVFYVGLHDVLTSAQDKRSIDLIIKEEKKHLIGLRKYAELLK